MSELRPMTDVEICIDEWARLLQEERKKSAAHERQLAEAQADLTRLRALVGAQRGWLDFALRALKVAQPIVCSMCCPSTKKIGEEWQHKQPCDSIGLTRRTIETHLSELSAKTEAHVCGARGFGQELNDTCLACEHETRARATLDAAPSGDEQ